MDQLWNDVRFGIRSLTKNPSFAVVAILVLALGIAAATSIFSVVNAVLVRPLPYRDPSRLIAISSVYRRAGALRTFPTVSLNEVERWREESHTLESLGSFVFSAMPVNAGSQSLFLVAIGADPEFLTTLGVQPAIGHNLPGRGSTVKDPSVLISHRLWAEAFASDRNVLGRGFTLDGDPVTIVGVLPASFQFPRSDASYSAEEPDIIYPVSNIAESWGRNSTQWFAIGRLKPGATAVQAEAELKAITQRMAADVPAVRGMSVGVSPLGSETTRSVRPALLLTLGISMVLLLIACTNVMNLLFSRSAQRGREMAVRKALGASPWRLIRQMLTETACIALFAGVAGVVVARLILESLLRLSPAHLPVSGAIEIDWTVVAFAILASAAGAMVAGILPAVHRSRQAGTLIATTRSSAGRGLLRFQQGLMIGQVALGVGLLAAAGLLTHSLYRLSSVSPGFRTRGTVAFELAFPSLRPAEARRHYDRILEATRNTPGVVSAGWITNPPPEMRAGVFVGFSVVGSTSNARLSCNFQVTSEDYFQTAGVPLLRGRDFRAADGADAPLVAIINEKLAHQYFPNEDPLGKRIRTAFDGPNEREIVGVIADIHDRGLDAKTVATVYVPYRQMALAYGGVVARTAGPPEAIIAEIRRRVALADPTVPLKDFTTVQARLSRTLDAPRFYTVMAAACALMAVFFVSLGLYGVISYGVSRRTAEIGIRMALGAPREAILNGVLRQGLQMAALGVAAGVGLSLAATRLLRTLLFEIEPIDPATLALSAVLVTVVALGASYVPARRASRVHPIEALRQE